MKVYRWDLDKTYLDTDFESLRGLVRTAIEPAHKKRSVPGATPLLRGLSGLPDAHISVISGSPTQMRRVLTEKLRLDGMRFDQMVLKDNLENVRRGRIRAVRGQLGYKLPALLSARASTVPSAGEVLFGDDVEADALVYSVYADAVSGRIGPPEVARIMERAGAYDDEVEHALEALTGLERREAVERIFIRSERGVTTERMDALGPRVVPIRSWWQAAAVLYGMGHISAQLVVAVIESTHEREGKDTWRIAALAQDIVRRGVVSGEILLGLPLDAGLLAAIESGIEALGPYGRRTLDLEPKVIDYLALLESGEWNKHGQADTGH